ncbi:MAG: putative dependent oxidoreductase [Hydrocarboniphaga sp.]|uniref:NAD(P)/FAD-dependent oxidoreductase n=1 Tax=Hydrocarboniphaga sp. TaxID=2033016 RepID=UPI00260E0A8A|nr:NAD(P)/FAD-dependent oxidoreductase [Hydrocarboniphaga sp.]MDB5972455.1 putative dependent oxidoreductase [Hydrocarboniphaga sp.]
MDTVDCIVIGAGVVGLAIARRIAMSGRETLILERENAFGTATSSRNSEVIHAGIYYPQGSLKARLCVSGKQQLYDYCERYGVEHRRCGKLIVASHAAQQPELARIDAAARRNGVDDLQMLDRAQALQLEPALQCSAALLSPSTGIIDSHGYMLSLLGQAEAHGAMLAYRSPVTRLIPQQDGIAIVAGDDPEPQLRARCVINAAGIEAPDLARRVEGIAQDALPRAYYAKGSYFTLSGRAPFSRLIYPVPEPGGLGVHLTLDHGGQARFGPDVQWVERPDYQVDASRADRFYDVIRAYWPGLKDGSLAPGYAGIRPKISGPGEAAADFRIDGPEVHRIPGLINLFGIESPGLTASLAIADEVGGIAEGLFN